MDRKTAKRARLIQLVHVGKNRLGLSGEDYRALLDSVTGKASCTDMTAAELEAVLAAEKALGFEAGRPQPVTETDYAGGKGHASFEQIKYIKGMWFLVARDRSDRALNRFICRITGAGHIRFCTRHDASDVIRALRDMMIKAGYNPDGPEQAAEACGNAQT